MGHLMRRLFTGKRAYKRSHLVALRQRTISASDPPSAAGRAMKRPETLSERPFRNWSSSVQLIEQRLGLLEHRRIEAFGKPVVDGREQIASLGSIALVAPEAGETGGGP